ESVPATNWALIVGYYDMLIRTQTSPVVELHHQAHSARADLSRRLGSHDEAASSYRRAIELVRHGPERRYRERQLGEISRCEHPICPFPSPPFDCVSTRR